MDYKQSKTNISYDNVKEVSLVTKYIFMVHDDNAYIDLLRVSKGWISYERTNYHTKKNVCSWSYKSSSNALKEKFISLINVLNEEYNNPAEG